MTGEREILFQEGSAHRDEIEEIFQMEPTLHFIFFSLGKSRNFCKTFKQALYWT